MQPCGYRRVQVPRAGTRWQVPGAGTGCGLVVRAVGTAGGPVVRTVATAGGMAVHVAGTAGGPVVRAVATAGGLAVFEPAPAQSHNRCHNHGGRANGRLRLAMARTCSATNFG